MSCNCMYKLASRISISKITLASNRISSTQRRHSSVGFTLQNVGQQHQHGYTKLLHDPTKIASLTDAKSLHAIIVTAGLFQLQDLVFVCNNILANYATSGDMYLARKLFDEMTQRNVVSYNTMISFYSRDALLPQALGLLSEMRRCGFKPTQFTLGGLLSCNSLDLHEGIQLQSLIEKIGLFFVDAYSGTALLGMYGRYQCLDEAVRLFQSMPEKSLVTWNSMISTLGQMGYAQDAIFLLSELMRTPLGLSEHTIVSILSGFEEEDIRLGEQIHGLVAKYGFDRVSLVSNCLINMYSRCGAILIAVKMFEHAPVKDIVTWNTLIRAKSDQPIEVFDIFLKMLMAGLSPNETTLINMLSSCCRLNGLSYGEYVHAKMIKNRFECDVCSGSALVNFYAKWDKPRESHICFNAIAKKNTVSWNSLMQAYENSGSRSPSSVSLLKEMIDSGYYPNETSFSIVLKSSLKLEVVQIHSLAIKMGYSENAYVWSSLIGSYGRNGLLSDALNFVDSESFALPIVSSNVVAWIYNQTGQYDKTQELYAMVENPDTVSWNILIAACSRNGDYEETFELFDQMRRSQSHPDQYTYVSLLSVCTKLCNLALGSSLHGLIVKTNTNLCDTYVSNTMIDMYGKCGAIYSSVRVFDELAKKNVISWTAVVSALGLHGHEAEALERFREMEANGIRPDKVAFLAILSACRHGGLVKEGMEMFDRMNAEYGLEPEVDHYVVVIDLLTRNGRVREAEKLILGMPVAPNALIWRSFLQGCKKQRSSNSPANARNPKSLLN